MNAGDAKDGLYLHLTLINLRVGNSVSAFEVDQIVQYNGPNPARV